ncbi:lmo0937 family membrane protein [Patescibacteria group bacterium]|nr:lmo0937 family membrane protein [Patescibacteria group bacterium]
MLYAIAGILIIIWLLGLLLNFGGAIIHVLLVIAVIVILVRVIKGKKPIG